MERLLNNIIQGIFESPQVTFEKCLKLNKVAETPFLKAVDIFCWGTISQMMYELKDRLPYHNNGMILCGCMIAKTSNISDMDLELGIEYTIDCEIIEQGNTVVNALMFTEIIRKLPDTEINIEVNENNLLVIECEGSL